MALHDLDLTSHLISYHSQHSERETGRDGQEKAEGASKRHGAKGFRLDPEGDGDPSRVFAQGSDTATAVFWPVHSEYQAGTGRERSTKEAGGLLKRRRRGWVGLPDESAKRKGLLMDPE